MQPLELRRLMSFINNLVQLTLLTRAVVTLSDGYRDYSADGDRAVRANGRRVLTLNSNGVVDFTTQGDSALRASKISAHDQQYRGLRREHQLVVGTGLTFKRSTAGESQRMGITTFTAAAHYRQP